MGGGGVAAAAVGGGDGGGRGGLLRPGPAPPPPPRPTRPQWRQAAVTMTSLPPRGAWPPLMVSCCRALKILQQATQSINQ